MERGEAGRAGKVTEMLKDERGGGEIIRHYKSRERRYTRWSSGVGAGTGASVSSSPASPELSQSFPLPFFFSSLSAPPRNTIKITFRECLLKKNVPAGSG